MGTFSYQPGPNRAGEHCPTGDEVRDGCCPPTAGAGAERIPGELHRRLLGAAGHRTRRYRCGLRRLDRATYDAALIENRAVFHSWPEAGITGIVEAGSHPPLALGKDVMAYPHMVAQATDLLRQAGIEGPYALAINPMGTPKSWRLDVGQDLSIGYSRHEAEVVTLYLEESFSFRVSEPDAAVVLTME